MTVHTAEVILDENPVYEHAQLATGIEAMAHLSLPAVIARGDKQLTPAQNHWDVLTTAWDTLYNPGATIDKLLTIEHERGFQTLGNAAVGLFHNDMGLYLGTTPADESEALLVHTTKRGGGDVYAAWPGLDVAEVFHNPEYGAGFDDDAVEPEDLPEEHPHKLLLKELVDPHLTDARIYKGTVSKGDTVILVDGGRHSAWHRFDTDPRFNARHVAPRREVKASTLRNVSFRPASS
jgi:hypothetical protein